jgi:hypothetical protein
VLRHVVTPLSGPALITVGVFSAPFEMERLPGPLIHLNDSRQFTLALVWGWRSHRPVHLAVAPADGRIRPPRSASSRVNAIAPASLDRAYRIGEAADQQAPSPHDAGDHECPRKGLAAGHDSDKYGRKRGT